MWIQVQALLHSALIQPLSLHLKITPSKTLREQRVEQQEAIHLVITLSKTLRKQLGEQQVEQLEVIHLAALYENKYVKIFFS